MKTPRRVFVIDDSVVVRRMLTDIIERDPDLSVAGFAANGAMALAKLETLAVDVVTLDVEMPGMSGLDVLVELRRRYPALPIIMFSSLTERAAATTLDALERGATDYCTKPTMTGSREASIAHVQTQLIPKLHAIAGKRTPTTSASFIPRPATPQPKPGGDIELVAIGASTGGPNAISTICRQLTALSVPIVVVQHMPPMFTTLFAQRLSTEGKLPFTEVTDEIEALPGRGYIAPGDHHLRVERGARGLRLVLDRGPAENSVRPAVDVLFRSVAAVCGPRVLGIVLTGMGQDGLRGSEAIRNAGGRVIAQDEASSVVWGMPGALVREGLASAVLSLGEIVAEIERTARPRSARHVG